MIVIIALYNLQNKHVDSKIQRSTDKCAFRSRQSNFRRVHPAYDYCRAMFRCLDCAQRFDYRALGSSRKLRGAAENLIDGSQKRISVRMLLKGTVSISKDGSVSTNFVGYTLNQSEAIETYTPYDVTSFRPRKTTIAFFANFGGIEKLFCAPEQSLNSKIMNQCNMNFYFLE